MEHEHTEHVAADPQELYAKLADVENLPQFVPQMRAAHETGTDEVQVEARYDGHTQTGSAYFRRDPDARRIEWGTDGSAYSGWMKVDAENGGSRLTLHLSTGHPMHESDVSATLDAIRRLAESRL